MRPLPASPLLWLALSTSAAAAPPGSDDALSGLVHEFGQDGITGPASLVRQRYRAACRAGYEAVCQPEAWSMDSPLAWPGLLPSALLSSA